MIAIMLIPGKNLKNFLYKNKILIFSIVIVILILILIFIIGFKSYYNRIASSKNVAPGQDLPPYKNVAPGQDLASSKNVSPDQDLAPYENVVCPFSLLMYLLFFPRRSQEGKINILRKENIQLYLKFSLYKLDLATGIKEEHKIQIGDKLLSLSKEKNLLQKIKEIEAKASKLDLKATDFKMKTEGNNTTQPLFVEKVLPLFN